MSKSKLLYTRLSETDKGIAILIDPDKTHSESALLQILKTSEAIKPSFIFVGGSQVDAHKMEQVLGYIKQNTTIPILIFPGSSEQVSDQADGILFLSLISGRNPDYLIGHQIESARRIYQSKLEAISTGYILIDGGSESAVARISNTRPLPQDKIEIIEQIAMAANLLSHQCLYLEAGSGAKNCVSAKIISTVKQIGLPLIVGGGIRSIAELKSAHEAGANVVVIGNKIEEDARFLAEIKDYVQA